jgi:AbiV family abortive infection protein
LTQVIPHKDLEKGIEIILRNVGALLDSADLLHSRKRYLHSAIFSNLAVEEMAKVQLLMGYHEKGNDLPIMEWNRLSRGAPAHRKKIREYLLRVLTENPGERVKIPSTISSDQIIDLIADYHVRLKQRVLYVNWIENSNTWQWLPEIYSETEQMEISARLLNVRKRYQEYMKRRAR